jgi:hypothetical protein
VGVTLLRGIRYRAGRSLVLLLLTSLAVGMTVLVPAYLRAAQRSVLADRLAAAPPNAVALHLSADAQAGVATTADARARIGARVPPHYPDPPIGAADLPVVVNDLATARLAYRDGVCAHVTVSSGRCGDGAVVSERSAREHGITVGQTLTVHSGLMSAPLRVGGLYVPTDPAEPYWGRGGYFAAGEGDDGRPRLDAVLVADERALAFPGSRPTVSLDYALATAQVTVDEVGRLDESVAGFATAANAAQFTLDTSVGAVLDDIATESSALSRTVPVLAVPLLLVCWFVVYLAVAGVVEERAPEVGLAKLRGYPQRRATGFGRDESTVLGLVAVPLGVAGGLGLVELMGMEVEPWRWPVGVAVLVAVALVLAVVRMATGRLARRPALTLLRRVPVRTLRAAGITELVVVALAAASFVAALADRSSPLALLAPALLAVVVGVGTARLLELWSRFRVRRYVHKGRISGALAHAQLARRPAGRRVMVVVVVAVALVTFGGTAWDVAAQARTDAAVDSVGAPRVLRVAATDPATLATAVTAAAGTAALPVVRVTERYDAGTVELLAVDSARFTGIAAWRGHSDVDTGALRTGGAEVPVIVAGATPADDGAATTFSFPGLGEGAQRYRVVSHVDTLPRATGRALLVDLDTAVAAAERGSGLSDNTRLRYEVWAGDNAPADLELRLANVGVTTIAAESIPAERDRLAGGAPALGLRLALVAGGVAVLLAVGAVLLTAYLGARTRRYELAALRVAGVRRGRLRRAVLREYVHVLLVPGLVGLVVGVGSAALMLPGAPLVMAGVPTVDIPVPSEVDALAATAAATAAGLVLAVIVVLRLVSGATPDRLRDSP